MNWTSVFSGVQERLPLMKKLVIKIRISKNGVAVLVATLSILRIVLLHVIFIEM